MLDSLQDNLFSSGADGLTPLSVVSHANQPQLPEAGLAKMILDGCGLTFCAWCVKPLPCTCSPRILLESLAFVLAECASSNGLRFSLRISDTYSSQSCLVLQVSGHPTSESVSGLWPTPVLPNGGRKPAKPMSATGQTEDGKKRQVDLNYAVTKLWGSAWPTPKASDSEKRGEFDLENPRNGLPAAAKSWSTPTGEDYKSDGPVATGRYQAAVDNGTTIPTTVQRLRNQVLVAGGAGLPDQESGNSTGSSQGLQLNPRWVLTLMGLPETWLDGVELPSKPLATRRFRNAPKSSGE